MTTETLLEIQATVAQTGLRSFRVSYLAPSKPEHSFEPYCAILADSEFGEVRVFDVPDPDESQREIAAKTCRALNSFETLRGLISLFLAMDNCNYDLETMRATGFCDQMRAALRLADSPK